MGSNVVRVDLESEYSRVKYLERLEIKTLGLNLSRLKLQPPPYCIRFRPRHDLGKLDALPLEILQQVLGELDLQSVVNIKRTNRRGRDLVKSLRDLKFVEVHAADALNSALAVELGSQISWRMLYEALCTAECQCGDFGVYIHLLTCKRVCYRCFVNDPGYLPIDLSVAVDKHGLDAEKLHQLPTMKLFPGTYGAWTKLEAVGTLIDVASLLKKGIITKEHPLLRERLNQYYGDPLRYIAIVEAPHFDQRTKRATWGYRCPACEAGSQPGTRQHRRRFSEAEFHEHLCDFGAIQISRQARWIFEHASLVT